VAVAALRRLVSGAPTVDGLPVLIVSTIAAVVMLAGALVLGGDLDDDDGEDTPLAACTFSTRRWPWPSRCSWGTTL
jgi:hypothetical protein